MIFATLHVSGSGGRSSYSNLAPSSQRLAQPPSPRLDRVHWATALRTAEPF
jgi:hypothetical protein